MKYIIIFILSMLATLMAIAQYPKGLPSPFSNGFSQIGYSKVDSGLILTSRDTSWTPRYAGTVVRWLHAGVDTSLWQWNTYWKRFTPTTAEINAAIASSYIQNQISSRQPANSYYITNRLDSLGIGIRPSYVFQVSTANGGGVNWDGVTLNVIDRSSNQNIALGYGAMYSTTGNSNTALGYSAGSFSTGSKNISIGYTALLGAYGDYNTANGYVSGFTTDSNYNSFYGAYSGKGFNGKNSTFIGADNTVIASDTAVITSDTWGGLGGALGVRGTQTGAFITANGLSSTNKIVVIVTFNSPYPKSGGASITSFISRGTVVGTDSLIFTQRTAFDKDSTWSASVYLSPTLRNVTVLGHGAYAETNNQASIGDDSTIQLKAGKVRFNTTLIPTSNQVLAFNSANNEYRASSAFRQISDTATSSASTLTRGKGQNLIDSLAAAGATRSGSASFNGTAATLDYTVTHGLPYTPTQVVVTPTSANAAAIPFYISIKSSESFTITFTSPPTIGTNNLTFDWISRKSTGGL